MAYRIEFGLAPGEPFYAEFVIVDKNTGVLIDVSGPTPPSAPNTDFGGDYSNDFGGAPAMPASGIDHRLNLMGRADDYGCFGPYGITIASNSNGLITSPTTGLLVVNIPRSRFHSAAGISSGGWRGGFHEPRQSLHYILMAVPPDIERTQPLVTGTISFGDHR